ICRDGGAAAGPAQSTEALLHHCRASATDDDRGAGGSARGDASLDDVIDFGESLAGHSNSRPGLPWQAIPDVRRSHERDQQWQQHVHLPSVIAPPFGASHLRSEFRLMNPAKTITTSASSGMPGVETCFLREVSTGLGGAAQSPKVPYVTI